MVIEVTERRSRGVWDTKGMNFEKKKGKNDGKTASCFRCEDGQKRAVEKSRLEISRSRNHECRGMVEQTIQYAARGIIERD